MRFGDGEIMSQFGLKQSRMFIRYLHKSAKMSQSKFEYVRNFERHEKLLPNCFIVVRVDGKNFHQFADKHDFAKPNDKSALDVMTKAAEDVFEAFKGDVVLAYGQSDEFSFVFRRKSQVYSRRSDKIVTNVASLFASSFTFNWMKTEKRPLKYPPSFDARAVVYPTNNNLRDYLSWRQADCHINNLYNTTFWALVLQGGLSNREAEERLKGSLASDKNEILFSEFGLNYNNEPSQFKKGSTLYKKKVEIPIEGDEDGKTKIRSRLVTEYIDIIGDAFWTENPHILGDEQT